ncbi:hypothetical protein SKAU_G00307980 [Synaphobranchus kaupii]|uniref:UDP-glucuronosyltransferase n=1 Tax=Synaphobranchus kaupii TaxID=118154 RepID=A0A9Q1ERA9_SYNKA|nr:hypothetical protein SKAU_G00307980 [Synaphobranchus kaupii]
MHRSHFTLITLLIFPLPGVHGGNVLVFPLDGSHWVNMKVLTEELVSRGHNVTVVRPSNTWYIKEMSPHYTSITIQNTGGFDEEYFGSFVSRLLQIRRDGASFWARFSLEMESMSQFREMNRNLCEMMVKMFEDEQTMQALVDAKYDVVLTDPGFGGGVLLAHRLHLPLVFNAADIWLMRNDFVFEFPRPTMPNVVYIGGFQCKPAKPLPQDLEEFVQSSGEHGVIIMSLGTLVGQLPRDIAEEIAAAFAELPQKIIWRHTGERPETLGNNTLLVQWMPQNDLLGHPKTRAFVAHGGTNGVQEAIYHGVPIVGLPLIFDQPDNLSRMKVRGAAKIVDIANLDRSIFLQALQEVLHEPSYRMNMQRLSRLHLDQPMKPLDLAMFWIEFVMRHKGAAHLRTESYRMPWYAYHSVDVIMVLLAAVFVILLTPVAIIRFLCCRACKRKRKSD